MVKITPPSTTTPFDRVYRSRVKSADRTTTSATTPLGIGREELLVSKVSRVSMLEDDDEGK